MNGAAPRLQMRGIAKSFSGTPALTNVSFSCCAAEVHALCGENGAGKTTLMKILGGQYSPDAGEILIDGKAVRFAVPAEAARAGIGVVQQELSILPDRTVAQNIYLGREPLRFGLLDRGRMRAGARTLLDRIGSPLDPDRLCRTLSLAERQLVEIVKALALDARILVLDEPTAALDATDAARLLSTVERLRSEGVAVIYVSHRMPEVMALSDRVTVLKDGRLVATRPRDELDVSTIVRMMVGRDLAEFYPPPPEARPEPVRLLEVESGGNRYVDGISLALTAGEIVGVAGLEGSGKTELLRTIYGDIPFDRGSVRVRGRETVLRSIRAAIRAGIGYVPEDRRGEALLLRQDVRNNLLLGRRARASLLAFAEAGSFGAPQADRVLHEAGVRAARYDNAIRLLSGGNQQKVIIARSLASAPEVILFAEPTRGVDVAAKAAIYEMMRSFVAQGRAILFASSDLPEVLGLADRVLVMRGGRIVGELGRNAREEEAMAMAVGEKVASVVA
jgi:ribose transport system ATP-binding protein